MNGPTNAEIKSYFDSLNGLSEGEIEAFGGGERQAYYEVQILRPDRTQVVVSPCLTDKDAWYVVPSRAAKMREVQKEWNQLFNQYTDAKMMQIAPLPWPVARNLHMPKYKEYVDSVWRGSFGYGKGT